MLGRLIKFGAILVVIIVAGLTVYAYIGDLAPDPAPASLVITLSDD
jgi:hypothetical protein